MFLSLLLLYLKIHHVHLESIATSPDPQREFSPVPIDCPGLQQELVKIPVLQETRGILSYVYGCDEILSGNCRFPGGSVNLKRPCSLQCSCVHKLLGQYQIDDCYNVCRMPPVGQKCFINGTSAGGCCPAYTGCIPNINSEFGTIHINHTVSFPPYKSQRFRCMPGDTLSLEACLLFLKREAMPKIKFAYAMHAVCRCIAEDTFGFSLTVSPVPNIPIQRYLLMQRGDQILRQPVYITPVAPPPKV